MLRTAVEFKNLRFGAEIVCYRVKQINEELLNNDRFDVGYCILRADCNN